MKIAALVLFVGVGALLGCQANAGDPKKASSSSAPLDVVVNDIDGKAVDLKGLRGKALLIVNVASECGYTPQYAELQQLHTKYQDQGLMVLGFPSNDFGGQEPKEGAAIKKFASDEYGVTFALFEKVHAAGADASPLYKTLAARTGPGTAPLGEPKWNFTKYLVDDKGVVVAKFDSAVAPLSPELTKAIEAVLPKKKA